MVDLVTAVVFVGISAAVFGLTLAVVRRWRDPVRERVLSSGSGDDASGNLSPTSAAWMEGFAGQMPQLNFENGELDKDLRRAGYYRTSSRTAYLAIRNALVVLVVIATGIIAVGLGPEHQAGVLQALAVGLMAAVVVWGLPRVILAIQAKRRVERICRALPDALDMIGMCLGGGLALPVVLVRVSRELAPVHPDLAWELMIIKQQAEMSSLEFAFQRFADRIDGTEVIGLANLISQNERLGASVADTIREYADSMRLRWRQIAEERSGTAQIGVLFPVVLCLVPAVMIILWGPAVLEIRDFFRGNQEQRNGLVPTTTTSDNGRVLSAESLTASGVRHSRAAPPNSVGKAFWDVGLSGSISNDVAETFPPPASWV